MNDLRNHEGSLHEGGSEGIEYYKRDFWSEENLKFVNAHFRLEKVARIVNRMAAQRECDLLDVGCGPATLQHLLRNNIRYHGLDIAIHDPAPNLIETDFLEDSIKFGEKRFDIVVAQGVFEYVGSFQRQKFAEIREILTRQGIFIASYWNFGHRNTNITPAVNNIQPVKYFRQSLAGLFDIKASFPVSHNWKHGMPSRRLVKAVNMHVNLNIPLISPVLGVEYFFVCSPRKLG